MNMLQAEVYMGYAFALLGRSVAGVVMSISATVKSNVLAYLLFKLAAVYGPMMVAEYLPYGIQKHWIYCH